MEITNNYVEQILNKILSQTEKGKVGIGKDEYSNWTFYVKLLQDQSKEVNNGEIAVKIKNKDALVDSLKKYIILAEEFYKQDKFYFDLDDKSFHEKLILDLFINATNFDLNNFEQYVKIKTDMLKGADLTTGQIVVGNYLDADIVVEIRKNGSNLEGPYKFEISFDNNFEKFVLPSITFGKIKDELIIYCIQGEKEKQTNRLAKQLDRHFRKANKDVDMEDEILSQVSVSALVSLVIFFAYQKLEGVKNVEAVNFMPVRYEANLTAKLNRVKSEDDIREVEELHDRNQFNISNRFFNTLIRYVHHFGLDYDYDDVCEKLQLKLEENKNMQSENIVHDIEYAIFTQLRKDNVLTQ